MSSNDSSRSFRNCRCSCHCSRCSKADAVALLIDIVINLMLLFEAMPVLKGIECSFGGKKPV